MPIMPEFNYEMCDGCQNCAIACPGGGMVIILGKPHAVDTATCIYCCTCEAVCPQLAIRCEYTIVIEEE